MAGPKIEKPAVSKINPISKPRGNTIAPTTKAEKPERSKVDNDVALQNNANFKRKVKRRTSQGDKNRAGTRIHFISIDLDTGRVAFETKSGPPLRGDISTDLEAGLYTVKADVGQKLWKFVKPKVKSGLRFFVENLVGVEDVFTLVYDDQVTVLVSGNSSISKPDPLPGAVADFQKKVDQESATAALEAFQILDDLSEVTLYDTIDELYISNSDSLAILSGYFDVVKAKEPDIDMFRVRRAIEAFTKTPAELYVDSFDEYRVHESTFKPDQSRAKKGQFTLVLEFTYKLYPARSILVYGDDILDSQWRDPDLPEYREEGDLLYPKFLTAVTTPKMYNAKIAAYKQINEQFIELAEEQAIEAVKLIAEVYTFGSGLVAQLPKVMSGAAQGVVTTRTIITAAKLAKKAIDQGTWYESPQLYRNMRKSDAAYEEKYKEVKGKKGKSYFLNGVWWDSVLVALNLMIEMKNWLPNGRQLRGLQYFLRNPGSSFGLGVAESVAEEVERQRVALPDGCRVEYRVACQQGADAFNTIFEQMDHDDIKEKFYAVYKPP